MQVSQGQSIFKTQQCHVCYSHLNMHVFVDINVDILKKNTTKHLFLFESQGNGERERVQKGEEKILQLLITHQKQKIHLDLPCQWYVLKDLTIATKRVHWQEATVEAGI